MCKRRVNDGGALAGPAIVCRRSATPKAKVSARISSHWNIEKIWRDTWGDSPDYWYPLRSCNSQRSAIVLCSKRRQTRAKCRPARLRKRIMFWLRRSTTGRVLQQSGQGGPGQEGSTSPPIEARWLCWSDRSSPARFLFASRCPKRPCEGTVKAPL